MKQTKFLLSVFMAIVMMAMSPTKMWAEDVASVTIGGTTNNYDNFQNALTAAKAASSATLKLLRNVNIQGSSIQFNAGIVTLDLNDCSVGVEYASTIKVNGGSLTIVDSGTAGQVTCDYGSAVYATSGSLTIHAGTFISSVTNALHVDASEGNLTVSLDGGRFITTAISTSSIYTQNISALADGYAYYSTHNNSKIPDNTTVPLYINSSGPVNDVTVKAIEDNPGGSEEDAVSVTIGGTTTSYENIHDALTVALDADAATMKMLANVEINSSLNVNKGNVTLDLNGKTITSTAGLESPVLYLTAGSFSITDSSDDKNGEIKKNSPNLLKVTGGKLTISEGTFTADYFVLEISGEGTASLSGGKYMSTTSSSAIWNDSGKSILANGCAFYITGTNTELFDKAMGSIYTPTNALASNITVMPGTLKATLTIGDVTTDYFDFMTAYNAAINSTSPVTMKMLADVNITPINSGNSLEMANGNVTINLNSHKIYTTNGAIVLLLEGGSLTIDDSSEDKTGTMESSVNNALKVTGGSLRIHGGKFVSAGYSALYVGNGVEDVKIDGGKFIANGSSSAIENYSGKSILVENYAFYNSEGNKDNALAENLNGNILDNGSNVRNITVKKATPKATLTINGETTDYFDFMTAYNVAINSTNPVTMKLLADVNITPINSGNSLEMANGNVTIDLNSHKFSASGGCVWILTGGSLTIDDSSEDKTGTIETNHNSVLSHVGGTLTIHEGKFVSTDSYALDTYGSPNRVISINGGRFIGASTAIFSTKDVLPDGYSYFNAENGMKLSTKSSTYENGQNVSEVIVRANATVINDGAFTCPVSYTPESVTFTRTITKDGGKYSFIVPFDIPADKAATLGKFYNYENYEDETVYFAEETEGVRANTAYFFDPADSFDDFTLNNAEIKATTSMADATNPSVLGLYGTYKKIAAPVGAYGYASDADADDKFVRAGEGSKVNAFRCYLWLGSDATSAKANAIFGFDEATGINATKADYLDLNAPMYNLRGQRITSPQKGEIYIMGGKKVIFK